MTPQAYPLQWPAGWPKTKVEERSSSTFRTVLGTALNNLRREIARMGGKDMVLSSNCALGQTRPKDSGVCAYFQWCAEPNKYPQQWIPMAIPCDRWNTVEANVQAIALTVDAMRGMDRWGAKHMIQAMFSGFKALPPANGKSCWEILGIPPGSLPETIKSAYRALSKIHHPDTGGDNDSFREIQDAYESALGLR